MYEALAMTLTMERLTAFFSGVEPRVAETQPNILFVSVRTQSQNEMTCRSHIPLNSPHKRHLRIRSKRYSALLC